MSLRLVTIIDYGVGNIGSLANMFEFIGADCEVADEPTQIARAELLVLPGVGAFDFAMEELERRGLIDALEEAVLRRKTPILGICLGMQILALESEEGTRKGLGFVQAKVKKLAAPEGSGLKVPHIGWADLNVTRRSPMFPNGSSFERFYFVHSYALHCSDPGVVAATIPFGADVCCAVAQGNICGVQFHPEKSHRFGMRLLRDFHTHA